MLTKSKRSSHLSDLVIDDKSIIQYRELERRRLEFKIIFQQSIFSRRLTIEESPLKMSIGNPARMKSSPPWRMFDNGNWNFQHYIQLFIFVLNTKVKHSLIWPRRWEEEEEDIINESHNPVTTILVWCSYLLLVGEFLHNHLNESVLHYFTNIMIMWYFEKLNTDTTDNILHRSACVACCKLNRMCYFIPHTCIQNITFDQALLYVSREVRECWMTTFSMLSVIFYW